MFHQTCRCSNCFKDYSSHLSILRIKIHKYIYDFPSPLVVTTELSNTENFVQFPGVRIIGYLFLLIATLSPFSFYLLKHKKNRIRDTFLCVSLIRGFYIFVNISNRSIAIIGSLDIFLLIQ